MDSPCVGDCRINNGECVGCGRTLAEIKDWARMSAEGRQRVMERVSES